MATSLTNLSELSHVNKRDNIQVLSFTEELSKLNKIKYNLSIVYFMGLAILLTTLLW